MSKKKGKGGRKGKYADWITEDGLLKLEAWARDGLTDDQVAQNIGIHRGTLYEWKKRYPEIDDALKRGKEVVDIEVENALLKRALGSYAVEEKEYAEIDEDGNKKMKRYKVKKYIPPDVGAIIWWLKNRKRENWREKPKTELDLREQKGRIAKQEAEIEMLKASLEDPDDRASVSNFIGKVKESIDVKEIFDDDNNSE